LELPLEQPAMATMVTVAKSERLIVEAERVFIFMTAHCPLENVANSIAVAAVMLFPDVALYHTQGNVWNGGGWASP
jgi:hypothetical protein